jgi:hypothetical protein
MTADVICHSLIIRLLISQLAKNTITARVRFIALTKIRDFEIWMTENWRSRKHTGRRDCVYVTGKSYSVFTANAQNGPASTGIQPPNALLCLHVKAISIWRFAESHLCMPKVQGGCNFFVSTATMAIRTLYSGALSVPCPEVLYSPTKPSIERLS